MFKKLDALLDSITMYRLVLYVLTTISLYSLILSGLGLVSFSFWQATASLGLLGGSCALGNLILSSFFKAPVNVESSSITSLILFLTIDPKTVSEKAILLILAGLIASSSKYVLAIKAKHIFNPAAITLFVLGMLGFGGATWWVGSKEMLLIALLSLLVVRKIRKNELFFSFLVFSLVTILLNGYLNGENLQELLLQVFFSWPLVFFAGIMLTEPLTSPVNKYWQVLFGLVVGILFGMRFAFGIVYSSPELALIVGNILAFFVTKNVRQTLELSAVEKLNSSIWEFRFKLNRNIDFLAGQYAEITLPHTNVDSRGNRRYFTIASSPLNSDISFAMRIDKTSSSSFKKTMMEMKVGAKMFLTQIGGDFVLPVVKSEKLVFVAGGVGITPYVAMIRDMLKKEEKRDIVLFYLVRNMEDVAYEELISEAQKTLGLKLFLLVSEAGDKFEPSILKKEVSDVTGRTVYLSGSSRMVEMTKEILKSSGVLDEKIRTDYFAGY